MQATLDAYSLKAVTKALTCVSKYGEELTIYATPEFMSFSATNSSKSAYCRFKYERSFFSRFNVGTGRVKDDDWADEVREVTNVRGQLMTKSFLSILKHKTVEKSVEHCEISIVEGNDQEGEEEDSLESKLIVRLHCKHGVVKTHRLQLLTPTALMSPGVPDAVNESRLTIGPKALKDFIEHFPSSKSARSDPQLVWTFDETEVGLKSIESSIDARGKGQLSTELTISAEEFDVYDIYTSPITISFHLREFTATIAFADSMSQSLELRFTDPANPLFIDLEGDNVESLFVISTSQTGGTSSGTQRSNSQASNTKKRERDLSESETPRIKKPMKVVQPADPETYADQSRRTSRVPGSMPPPSIIPNRSTFHAAASGSSGRNSLPRQAGPSKRNDPLFLPSSQMSAADEEVLRSTGLGIENMNAEELAEMLEGEGEEVDFSHMSQPPSSMPYLQPNGRHQDEMQVDDPDSLDLVEDMGLAATQSTYGVDKTFQPLFED